MKVNSGLCTYLELLGVIFSSFVSTHLVCCITGTKLPSIIWSCSHCVYYSAIFYEELQARENCIDWKGTFSFRLLSCITAAS